jgi:predicted transcriptional regulator
MTADRVVLLSIRAKWARAIFDEEKAYEYRKRPPAADPPYRVVLYATGGPSECWGEAVVDRVVSGVLDTVIGRTVGETPHSPDDVRAYFGADRQTGAALHLTEVRAYDEPVPRERLEQVVPGFVSPQNFRYLSRHEYDRLTEVRR